MHVRITCCWVYSEYNFISTSFFLTARFVFFSLSPSLTYSHQYSEAYNRFFIRFSYFFALRFFREILWVWILCKHCSVYSSLYSHHNNKQNWRDVKKSRKFHLNIQQWHGQQISFRPFLNAITYLQRKTIKLARIIISYAVCSSYIFSECICANKFSD